MNRKQRVIEAATQLFAEQGFEKTPISLICEVAEVSKGTVFHHFKNKDEILRAVFVHISELIEEADKKDENIENEDILLSSMIESIFDGMMIPEHRQIYQFNFNVMVHPVTRAIVADLIKERYRGLQASTEKVFQTLGHDNPTIITKLFIAEIDGIAMNYLLNDEFPIESIKLEFIRKYVH